MYCWDCGVLTSMGGWRKSGATSVSYAQALGVDGCCRERTRVSNFPLRQCDPLSLSRPMLLGMPQIPGQRLTKCSMLHRSWDATNFMSYRNWGPHRHQRVTSVVAVRTACSVGNACQKKGKKLLPG